MSKSILETLKGITLENFQGIEELVEVLNRRDGESTKHTNFIKHLISTSRCRHGDVGYYRLEAFLSLKDLLSDYEDKKLIDTIIGIDAELGYGDLNVIEYYKEYDRILELCKKVNSMEYIYVKLGFIDRSNYLQVERRLYDLIEAFLSLQKDQDSINKLCRESNVDQSKFEEGYNNLIHDIQHVCDTEHKLKYSNYFAFFSFRKYYIEIFKRFVSSFTVDEFLKITNTDIIKCNQEYIENIYNILTECDNDIELLKNDLEFEKNSSLKRLEKQCADVMEYDIKNNICKDQDTTIVLGEYSYDITDIAISLYSLLHSVHNSVFPKRQSILEEEFHNLHTCEVSTGISFFLINSLTDNSYAVDSFHRMHLLKEFINKFNKEDIVEHIMNTENLYDLLGVETAFNGLRYIIYINDGRLKSLENMKIFSEFDGDVVCEYTPKNDKNETIDLFERIDYKHDGDLSDKELIEYALDVLYKLELKYDVFKECLKNEYALITDMFDSMINNL